MPITVVAVNVSDAKHFADSEIVMVDRGFMVDLPSSQGVHLLVLARETSCKDLIKAITGCGAALPGAFVFP